MNTTSETRTVHGYQPGPNAIESTNTAILPPAADCRNAMIPFDFDGVAMRVVEHDGEPWFVASDVATVLDYRMASDMTRTLDDDEKGTQIVRTPGGDQEVSVISESGLYSAILSSRKPEAKRFKKWVTSEVLPAIRKTGSYRMPATLSRLELLELAMESERARLAAEAARDHAIATKAQIGSRREATAMAAASRAVRELTRVQEQLGFSAKHATVIAVEHAIGRRFDDQCWRRLRAWCEENHEIPVDVPDRRYGTVKAWPAGAWLAVFSVDLAALFPSGEVA